MYKIALHYPKSILTAIILVTVFLGYHASKISLDGSLEAIMIKGDPGKEYYEQVKKTFGPYEVIIVAITAEDIFTYPVLSRLRHLSDAILQIDGVDEVKSLTNTHNIVGKNDTLDVSNFIKEIPRTKEGLEALKASALENKLYVKNLFSRDYKTAAINVFLKPDHHNKEQANQVVKKIQKLLEIDGNPHRPFLTGTAVYVYLCKEAMVKDISRFIPFTLLLIAVVLYITFRSPGIILVPLVVLFLSVIWALGIMSLSGTSITLVTTLIPPLIMANSTSYSIRILTEYRDAITHSKSHIEAIERTMRRLHWVIIASALTTAAGFGSLMANSVSTIHDLGKYSAIGILCSLVLNLFFTPTVLSLIKLEPARIEEGGFITKLLAGIGRFNEKYKYQILLCAVIVLSLSVYEALRIRPETDYAKFFPEDAPVNISMRHVNHALAGEHVLCVNIKGEPDSMKSPDNLRVIENLEDFLKKECKINSTISYVDFIKQMNKAMHNNEPDKEVIPDTRPLVAQYLLLHSMAGGEDDLKRYLSYDYSEANVVALSTMESTAEFIDMAKTVRDYGNKHFKPPLQAEVTGINYLISKSSQAISCGFVNSLSLASLIIFGISAYVFKSFRVGLVALIPDFLPVINNIGFMSSIGETLNIGTSVIACIAMGMGVDDTVHYVLCYKSELGVAKDSAEAMHNTLRKAGKPIVYTSMAMALGFLVFTTSEFTPLVSLGYLTAVTAMTCLLGDLILLPVLLNFLKLKK